MTTREDRTMVYEVQHDGNTTYIQAKPHRAHYVARQIAPEGDYTLTPVGRAKQIRAHARAKRRLAERRRVFESLVEGGES